MNELRNFISENDIPITESKFREMEKLINKIYVKQLEADKAELLGAVKLRLTNVLIKIDAAVEENFGYSPDYKWFDDLLTERDNLNQLIQKYSEGK